ncbi:zf-U1-domain-containing protein [Pluteus cervinus]|uniref:Zf-U1-domain-containing protein n=1 Tax=Pluteus cervinus TaxID=181527 RepID=A0ACD3B2H2_9AGAR|nr:zf-U1-domain-containing protein [Pluteus cervinus]
MPKHYCDYCDVFLTHDSASVRKAHNSGRNHLANVRDYYASLGHDKAQSIIDQITSAYESSGGPPPGGFGFGPQHLGPPPPFMPGSFPGGMPPPGFAGGRPPFPPGPGFPPMGPPGAPPFPPNGGLPPPGMVPPPFPPNGPPGMGMPPFAPNGGPPTNFPPGGPNFNGPPGPNGPPGNGPSSGPSIHPDRLRMMGNGGGRA